MYKLDKFITFKNSKYYWKNNNIVRVYIDMDNVLCNYNKSFKEKIKKEPSIKYPQSQYKFFEDLEPIKKSIESYKILSKFYDVRILTSPSINNRLCYTEKAEWVYKHLGVEALKNLNISTDKSQFEGQFLIDDLLVRGVYEFSQHPEKEHIHFGSKKFPDWNSVIKYLIK